MHLLLDTQINSFRMSVKVFIFNKKFASNLPVNWSEADDCWVLEVQRGRRDAFKLSVGANLTLITHPKNQSLVQSF